MSDEALAELSSALDTVSAAYRSAKKKAQFRVRVTSALAVLLGGAGISLLALRTYDLLGSAPNLAGDQAPQTFWGWIAAHSTSIGTILILAGAGISALARNRGYLTQLLRYSLALSEIEILIGIQKVERALTADQESKARLAREGAQKLAEIVRGERVAFSTDTRQDLQNLSSLIERSMGTANELREKV